MRVVSLVPSVTETLLAWGVDVVACTRFCEQPDLVHVGGTKDPDVAAIVDLQPDLVVVDREENRRDDADALVAAGVALHVTDVRSVDIVGQTLAALADRCGATRPDPIDLSAAPIRASAFVPIWRRPWMSISADTYGSSLLERLGIANVFAPSADRYPQTDLAEVRARRPDVVLLPSEPYPFAERHRDELEREIDAPTVLIDGADLFWWGVRTPGAADRLRDALREVSRRG